MITALKYSTASIAATKYPSMIPIAALVGHGVDVKVRTWINHEPNMTVKSSK